MTTNCGAACAPLLDRHHLQTLLDALLTANIQAEVASGTDGSPLPLAVGVIGGRPDTVEVEVRPLDGDDPVRDLYGFVAPPGWTAMGMVATGQSRLLPAPVTERVTARVGAVAADQPVARVGLAMAVDRSGRQITVVRGLDDGHHLVEGPDGRDASPEGRIPDACRRGLGLPTPPPGSEVIELWASVWLDQLLLDAVAEPRARTWVEAAGRFPASGTHRHDAGAPATDAQITTRLIASGRVAARGRWGELRRRWGRWSGVRLGVDRHTASWMDDGMFSREVLGAFPLIDDLLVELGALYPPDVLGQAERALRAWGLA